MRQASARQGLGARRQLWLLVVLFGLWPASMLGAGCNGASEEAAAEPAASAESAESAASAGASEGSADAAPRSRVEAVTVESVAFEDHIELTGVTEPVVAALVTPEIGGRVLEIGLVEGESVEADQTVLVVDTSTMGARIGSLEVQAEQLKRDVERTEKLVARGLATKSDLEALQTQRSVLKKQIQEVRVGKRQAVTRAPISGVVTERQVEPGEFASGGQSVGRIVDVSTIVVRVGLPESDIRYVREGQAVEVRVEALERSVTGTLHRIGLEANPRNRTFPLEIRVPNADLAVRAGMRTTVRLVRERHEDAVVVPRDAIVQALEGSQVFVIGADGTVQARDVVLGPGLVRFVLIERGLAVGERLVVRGQRALVQGEPVEVTAEQPCCAEQLERYLAPAPLEPAPVGQTAEVPAASDAAGDTPEASAPAAGGQR